MKTEAQKTGLQGEDHACRHLTQAGYLLLERNWKKGRAEIDIIAKKDDVLVFIEVKTRTNDLFGAPSAFVSEQQQARISSLAATYMRSIGHEWELRFDIIAIFIFPDGTYRLEHLQDAFFTGLP